MPRQDELELDCDCKGNRPCQHIFATLARLAKEVDENPTLILQLRGVGHEQQSKPGVEWDRIEELLDHQNTTDLANQLKLQNSDLEKAFFGI